MMTAHERSHWRDQDLSERHRWWGDDCPAVDVDFLVIEYDERRPVALIDFKLQRPRAVSSREAGLAVLGRLGDMAGIPAFVVFYAPGCWLFRPVPLNALADEAIPEFDRSMTEREFVAWLYALRGREVPEGVARRLREYEELIA